MPQLELHLPVRWFFALILVTAAVLKLQYWMEGSAHMVFTASSLLTPGEAVAEILLALWLFTGSFRNCSLLVATGAFGCFALVSLWKISQGVAVCGCFGKWSPSPKWTYWMDVAAFALGLRALGLPWVCESAGKGICASRTAFRLLFAGIVVLSIGFFGAAFMHGRNVKSAPASWLDTSWPPTGAIDVPADLSRGRWIVLIYGSSCHHCRALAADYADLDQDLQAHERTTRVALIDADGDEEWEKTWSRPGLIEGKLLQSDLFNYTPIVLLLGDGRVRAVQEGWERIDWSKPPHSEWIR